MYSKGEISNITAPLTDEEIAQYKSRDAKFPTRGGYVTQPLATTSKDLRPNLRFPIVIGGREIWPEQQWIWSRERVEAAIANDEIVVNESSGKLSVRVKQYLRGEDGELRQMKPVSILLGPFNQEGSKETNELLGDDVFSFPKPVGLIRYLLSLTVNDTGGAGEIILDFFAGSGTSGQAVMELNQDGRRRRHITIQLPEPIDVDDRNQKAAADFCDKLGRPRNIAELTKERLRRAAQKIRDEHLLFAGDLGFRVFKLDSSNLRTWEPDRDDLAKTLLEAVEHVKPGRSEQDLLYELLLKLGLDLAVPIETRAIAGKAVHSVGAGVLIACLPDAIAREEVEPLAQGIVDWHAKLAPAGETTLVFRDSAFVDDVAKTNLAAILAQYGLGNVRSL